MISDNEIWCVAWEVHSKSTGKVLRHGVFWGEEGEGRADMMTRFFASGAGVHEQEYAVMSYSTLPSWKIEFNSELVKDWFTVIRNEDGSVTVMVNQWAFNAMIRGLDNEALVKSLLHENRITEDRPAPSYSILGMRPGDDKYGARWIGIKPKGEENETL